MFPRLARHPRNFASLLYKPPPLLTSRAYTTMAPPDQSADWHSAESAKGLKFSYFTKPIEKSQQDDRDYRLIRLENGLQAMLIHDAKADKAAASLDVAVGHLYDPVSIPSVASCLCVVDVCGWSRQRPLPRCDPRIVVRSCSIMEHRLHSFYLGSCAPPRVCFENIPSRRYSSNDAHLVQAVSSLSPRCPPSHFIRWWK